eukprot:TRINITY_DN3451_c0_g2_i3.p1 TRINITY_DN3451_c0_g2~~TRINITY_DN3451_c0_g2_i3.p1  ORF type:complete len:259 (-),score=10.85 TRINITY_DN3451_c0_g2_i3:1088-1864(-)
MALQISKEGQRGLQLLGLQCLSAVPQISFAGQQLFSKQQSASLSTYNRFHHNSKLEQVGTHNQLISLWSNHNVLSTKIIQGNLPGSLHLRSIYSTAGKQYSEKRLIGYSPQQLFEVVSSVQNYNKFVPWCQKSVVTKQLTKQYMEAELEVGFQLFIEKYTSKVQMQYPSKIKTTVADSSLFDTLDSVWEFSPGPTPNTCWVSFSVDFTFKAKIYQNVANVFLEEVVQRMVASFENRCAQLYGPPSISSKFKLNGAIKK